MSDDVFDRLKEALADRYLIQRELDRGGMAVVFLAEDLRHNRVVAIKVLQPDLSATLGTDRFLREIQVIANLQHPNILTLIDSGEVNGLPYYVMPFVEGHSLRTKLEEDGALALEEAVRIAREVAEALEYAHQKGVVHRDVKPANILLSDGHAVVADFGIAAALDESAESRITKTGSSLGSPAYMSPEQASGERELDGRADVYGLGCLVYEMLGGSAPFEGSLKTVVTSKVLGDFPPLKTINPEVPTGIDEAVSRALEVEPGDRFQTAAEFESALRSGLPHEAPAGWGRRRSLVAGGAVLLVASLATVAVLRTRAESERALLTAETIDEVERLAAEGFWTEALDLAEEVETLAPGDTTLNELLSRISYTVPIRTAPTGASVFIQALDDAETDWEFLGVTPLEEVRFAGLTYSNSDGTVGRSEERPRRLRFEAEGHMPRELLTTPLINARTAPLLDPLELLPDSSVHHGMVPIPAFRWGGVDYGPFFMDRFEVTNGEFKEFVDAGGYRNPEYWTEATGPDGESLSFEELMEVFRDQTGRPGPSTWRFGSFSDGEEDYPVGGVSWYEAVAYALWIGKELPTTAHWQQGLRFYRANSFAVAPRSNLDSDGPRPVGENRAMTTLGVFDMIGNVREWCLNEVGGAGRATRGGAWTEPAFFAGWIIPKAAMDRDETNGFRLVEVPEGSEELALLRAPVEATETRDYSKEEPVPDAQFEVFRSFYEYDRYPLNPVVERVDTFDYWVREVVWFDAPYGGRGGAALYIPKGYSEPYQAVVHWPGSGIMTLQSIDDLWESAYDYIVRTGRVVVEPLFNGAYERDDSLFSTTYAVITENPGGTVSRDYTIQWVKDLSASIDYLEERSDIDVSKLGFLGHSFGGWAAPIVMAVEPRIQVAVTNVGGLPYRRHTPETDAINFVTRVTKPFLMVNGLHDIVFPYETNQLPMYELLGTPPEHKRHYAAESSHVVKRDELISKVREWFDRYLGEPEPLGGPEGG